MAFWKKTRGALGQAFKGDQEIQKFVLTDVTRDATCVVLGSGSYGKVEEVKYRRLTCAGKSMHESLIDPENEGVSKIVRKYLQECQLMSSLRHPNITQFLGLCFFPDSQLPMIVMERLETSLDDLLELISGIPLSTKRKVLEDVASGLLYLHKLDPPVIHRDLTSRNILLTSSLVAKIADMGNSRIVNLKSGKMAQTLTKLPGTLVYMPPEALEDKSRYDPSLDVFSFGHLALYTITQRFPGDLLPSTYPNPEKGKGVIGRTELERREVYVAFLEALIGQVHPRLVELVKSCLDNDPAERPSTVELLSTLQDTKVEVEGDHGPMFQLDMAKVKLAQKCKSIQHTMNELTQQLEKLTEECTIKDQRIEELVQQHAAGEIIDYDDLLQQQNKQDAELETSGGKLEMLSMWKTKKKSGGVSGTLSQAFESDLDIQKFVLTDVTLDSSCAVLGSGSYGKVEEVKYRKVTCAGKSMLESLVDPGNEGVTKIVNKYLQECQLMSSLRHPNITQFLGLCFFPESQLPMIVMERLETSLDALLELIPNIPLSTKCKFLEDVASGLFYLHKLDPPIIHRDLTARNILLTSSLVAKIADMGNSRIAELKSGKMIQTLSTVPGTLVYMPPEALENKSNYYSSVDIFSFGHLALYVVTQRFPGDLLPSTYPNPEKGKGVIGRTELERREVYVTFLEALIGQVHPRLVELVKSCLDNDPAERPRTAELLSILQDTKVEVEGDHGAMFQLDMAKVRLAQEHKAKQQKMNQLTQQMERLTEECVVKDQRIEELVQQHTKKSQVKEIKMKDEESLQQQEPDHSLENRSEKKTRKLKMMEEEWKVAPEDVEFVRKIRLGLYSNVWEGLWKNCERITIKSSNQKSSEKFFNEAEILTSLKHLNIVALYGVCSPESLYIMEYVNKGSLLDLLHSDGKDYPFLTLLNMCTQVACGMAYLEIKKCIHRNLRAATILVDQNNICKISEFELAVNLHSASSQYVMGEGLKFAVKWTAPEAALLNRFSIKSDVWSFGILLYEFITHGKFPYPGMSNTEALQRVNDGYRMPCPPGCPDKFYSIMLDCWKETCGNRPTFEYLHYQFQDFLLEDTSGYSMPL